LPLLPVISAAQQDTIDTVKQEVKGYVYDAKTRQALPFVKVYNLTRQYGTITDYTGYYKLASIAATDSIQFSFIGYKKVRMLASEIGTVPLLLEEKTTQLGTVNILADDAYLYELLTVCAKNKPTETKQAKTYFGLETFVNDEQVELLECYYNGTYSGYNVDQLELKKGRSALNVSDEILYLSMDISKAFYRHDLFARQGNIFPYSPFEFNKRKLRKKYSLYLAGNFRDELGNTVYVVSFEPKENGSEYFKGKVWIDSTRKTLQKIELHIDDAQRYPFSDEWSQYAYENINLNITKTFTQTSTGVLLNAVYFDYDLSYKMRQGYDGTIHRKTRSVLQAFNYDETFHLPKFRYPASATDYRKISAARYDPYFWKNFNEFRVNSEDNRNEDFFRNSQFNNQTLFDYRIISRSSAHLFESEYIFWNKKRIFFDKSLVADSVVAQYFPPGTPPSTQYHLSAQIFMEIVELDDTLYVNTATVFDPFETYYYLPITRNTHIFMNAYFDLLEVHRRSLEKEIADAGGDVATIEHLYDLKMRKIAKESEKFFFQVDRGENSLSMGEWNAYIWKKLHIDNIEIFSPAEKEEETEQQE
jgi:hypothetical protein